MHCVMRMVCWCATQENAQKKHFSFRCHRSDPVGSQPQEVYSVNSICFNDAYKTFATCGSDGQYNFWDKQNKQRLKAFKRLPDPITCGAFSADARIFAYASCYDWHKVRKTSSWPRSWANYGPF